jgi:hypothetical protein
MFHPLSPCPIPPYALPVRLFPIPLFPLTHRGRPAFPFYSSLSSPYPPNHRIYIPNNLFICESNNMKTYPAENAIPFNVRSRIAAMDGTFQFND